MRDKYQHEGTHYLKQFEGAKFGLEQVRMDVAREVGRSLVRDVNKYQNAMKEIVAAEQAKYYQLENLAAQL